VHNGKEKARVAAMSAQDIFPGLKTRWFCGNILFDLGMGVYKWADLVMAGLDNREARLHINRFCWKVNTIWIDGAIEAINGVARVFIPPYSACYECTMNDNDWKELQSRRSCNLLTGEEMELGKVPTTPTISSIIAGVQCQEMLKILHGIDTCGGAGFVFNGMFLDSYIVNYPRKEDCLSHEVFDNIIEVNMGAKVTELREVLSFIKEKLGAEAVLELNNDILTGFQCRGCGKTERILKSLGKATLEESLCPDCNTYRTPELTHTIDGSEDFLEKTLFDIGVPLFDILTGRLGLNQIFFELSLDRHEVLGPLLQENLCNGVKYVRK